MKESIKEGPRKVTILLTKGKLTVENKGLNSLELMGAAEYLRASTLNEIIKGIKYEYPKQEPNA